MKKEEKRAFRLPFPRSQMRDNFSPLVSSAGWSRRRMGSSSKFFEFDQRARTSKRRKRENIGENERERSRRFHGVPREFEPTGNLFTPFFECIRRLDNCRSRRRDERLIWIDRRVNRRAKRFISSNSILSRAASPAWIFCVGSREDIAIKSMLHEYRISCNDFNMFPARWNKKR